MLVISSRMGFKTYKTLCAVCFTCVYMQMYSGTVAVSLLVYMQMYSGTVAVSLLVTITHGSVLLLFCMQLLILMMISMQTNCISQLSQYFN